MVNVVSFLSDITDTSLMARESAGGKYRSLTGASNTFHAGDLRD